MQIDSILKVVSGMFRLKVAKRKGSARNLWLSERSFLTACSQDVKELSSFLKWDDEEKETSSGSFVWTSFLQFQLAFFNWK